MLGYKGKFTKKRDSDTPAAQPAKPVAAMNVLYGDLVSEDDLPDSNPDGTVCHTPNEIINMCIEHRLYSILNTLTLKHQILMRP